MSKFFYSLTLIFSFFTNSVIAENGSLPNLMPVTEVVFMGAHNAAMSTNEGWIYAQQNKDLEDLWASGVRMIKIPLHWYKPSGVVETLKKGINKIKVLITKEETSKTQPFLALCHEYPGTNNCQMTKLQRAGKDPQPARQLFERLAALLKEHPKEVFILKLENYLKHQSKINGADQFTDAQVIQIFKNDLEQSGLAQYAISLQDRTSPLTLGEMRSTNKRLIILDTANINGIPSYINSFTTYTRQTHWDNELMKECGLTSSNRSSHMFFEVGVAPEVSVRQDTVAGKIIQGGVKIADSIGIKRKGDAQKVEASDYKKVNSEQNIKERIQKCYIKHGISPSIITSDFVHIGDLEKVVQELNQSAANKYK